MDKNNIRDFIFDNNIYPFNKKDMNFLFQILYGYVPNESEIGKIVSSLKNFLKDVFEDNQPTKNINKSYFKYRKDFYLKRETTLEILTEALEIYNIFYQGLSTEQKKLFKQSFENIEILDVYTPDLLNSFNLKDVVIANIVVNVSNSDTLPFLKAKTFIDKFNEKNKGLGIVNHQLRFLQNQKALVCYSLFRYINEIPTQFKEEAIQELLDLDILTVNELKKHMKGFF